MESVATTHFYCFSFQKAVLLSSDVVQAVKATKAGIFVDSYILNYQDLATISIGTLH